MTPAARGVLRGMALLARFRAEGLEHFGGSAQSVLNSLAPLLAFPAVLLMVVLMQGRWDTAVELLAAINGLLLQAVLSEAAARRWGREAEWGRYAVAFNWCQWILPVIGMGVLIAVQVLVMAGLAAELAAVLVLLLLLGYAIAMQWFLAWKALRLRRRQAALLVFGINLCISVMAFLPTQLGLLLEPAS